MEQDRLLQNITLLIGLEKEPSEPIDYKVLHAEPKDGYEQQLIEYYNDGNRIPAYLLIPECHQHCPAVLIHHQHNGERHLGKSEVCGRAGNPLHLPLIADRPSSYRHLVRRWRRKASLFYHLIPYALKIEEPERPEYIRLTMMGTFSSIIMKCAIGLSKEIHCNERFSRMRWQV